MFSSVNRRLSTATTATPRNNLPISPSIDRFLARRDGTHGSTQDGLRFEQQFWQDKTGADLKGIGCGELKLTTPWVDSQYPSPSHTKLEIESGEEIGKGSIRLIGPQAYWPGPSKFSSASFLVPFAHIEVIAVVPYHPVLARDPGGFQILIIPTAAVGVSPLKGRLPRCISFAWPNKPADKELGGSLWANANQGSSTYLSILKVAMNEQMAPFAKKVVSPSHINGIQLNASLRLAQVGRIHSTGLIHMLDTGILFLSSSKIHLFFPHKTLAAVDLVVNRDQAGRKHDQPEAPKISFDMAVLSNEPSRTGNTASGNALSPPVQDSRNGIPLYFCDISLQHMSAVITHLRARGIPVELFQRMYANYKKGEFVSGWQPMNS